MTLAWPRKVKYKCSINKDMEEIMRYWETSWL